MEDQIHFIQKQKLIFDFPSEEKAIAWNRNASSFYYAEIAPLLNQFFNKYIPGDQVYLLNSLVIDLGKIHRSELKEALVRKLEMILPHILAREHHETKFPNSKKEDGGLKAGEDATPMDEFSNGVTIHAQEEKLLKVFYTFLDYGILSWNCDFDRNEKLENEILKRVGIARLTELKDFKGRMNQPFVRRRLIHQFSKRFVEQVLKKMLPDVLEVIGLFKSLIAERVEKSSFDVASKSIIRKVISEETLRWIIESNSVGTGFTLAENIIHAGIGRIEEQLQAKDRIGVVEFMLYNLLNIESHVDQGNKVSPLLNQVAEIIRLHPGYDRIKKKTTAEQVTSKGSPKEDQRSEKDSVSGTSEELPTQDLSNAITDDQTHRSTEQPYNQQIAGVKSNDLAIAPITSSTTDPELTNVESLKYPATGKSEHQDSVHTHISEQKNEIKKDRPQPLSEYYVLNAGIILCWPYLARLFDRLGYLLSADFGNVESHERAVHVLGYIASGHENCEEHELTLAKLLTSWPIQMPLVKELKLLKKERRESDKMLKSLIVNWPILKNTSVDGLRSSFFQRDGKLKKEDDGWRLIVEQKSYDMLLDYIPYSIAIVKLPWTKEILKVDWA